MARFIRLSSPEGGVVLDPFLGSGTTAIAAQRLGRKYIGIEKKQAVLQNCRRPHEEGRSAAYAILNITS